MLLPVSTNVDQGSEEVGYLRTVLHVLGEDGDVP